MTTVIIDTRSKEAKKILEYLKTAPYAKVFEEYIPNDETIFAINEVEDGNVNSYNSVSEMLSKLKKKSGV
jgi:hypothetical protein